ncbi:hypothetical protein MHBO_004712, partial [Bonamia ostreae]
MPSSFIKDVSWNLLMKSDDDLTMRKDLGFTKYFAKNKKISQKKKNSVLTKLEKKELLTNKNNEIFKSPNFYISNQAVLRKNSLELNQRKSFHLFANEKIDLLNRKFTTKEKDGLKNIFITYTDFNLDYEKIAKLIEYPCVMMQGWLEIQRPFKEPKNFDSF